jgi:hypothetical protein
MHHFIPLQLPLAPMRLFAIGVGFPRYAAMQRQRLNLRYVRYRTATKIEVLDERVPRLRHRERRALR